MDSEHALCRNCRNVVRTDWEHCFHCGARAPVSTPVGTTVVRSAATVVVLAVAAVLALNAQSIWRAVRETPELVARGAPVAASVAHVPKAPAVPGLPIATGDGAAPAFGVAQPGITARTVPLPTTTSGGAQPSGTVFSATGDVSHGQPTASTTTASTTASTPASLAPAPTPGIPSARRLNEAATARLIAECESRAALDTLERRLREEYPADPSLGVGGATWRRLRARRAALTLP